LDEGSAEVMLINKNHLTSKLSPKLGPRAGLKVGLLGLLLEAMGALPGWMRAVSRSC
jgi:hypothetical protein